MAKLILKNTRLFAAGTDFTANNSKLEIDDMIEEKDATNFASAGAKEVMGGLESCKITASGQWEALDLSKVDDALWAGRGLIGPWTATPDTANVGDLAYLTQALTAQYKLLGAVGDIAPWDASAAGSWPLVRGQILHPPGTARTATGTGTARQIGAVASGKSLYVALHVLSVAGTGGPTLTITIESDDNSGFTSAVTAGTFTAATAISGQVLKIVGPITDDWFRVKYTIAGTTPSFLFVVSAGIANT